MIQNIASVITSAAIILVLIQLVGERSARHRSFESLYVQRYWTLADRIAKVSTDSSSPDTLNPEVERACIAYLRLCEDQLELRENGHVTDATWTVWSWGMKQELKTPRYVTLLEEQSPTELIQLREFLQHGKDPLKKRLLPKWWAGLH